eukprot:scaffold329_cov92-Skeletonema_dohrnii-CCMP3373.AAC.10
MGASSEVHNIYNIEGLVSGMQCRHGFVGCDDEVAEALAGFGLVLVGGSGLARESRYMGPSSFSLPLFFCIQGEARGKKKSEVLAAVVALLC